MSARQIPRRLFVIVTGVLVVLLVVGGLVLRGRGRAAVHPVPFSDLLHALDAGSVAAIAIDGDALDVTLTSGRVFHTNAPANYVTANPAFVTDLAKRQVRIDVRSANEPSALNYLALIVGLTFLGVLGVAMYRVTSGRIPALENKAREAANEASTVTFEDVAGVDEAKEEVKEIVDFLREPARFSAIGGRIPKGVLLVGPPGTGKTLLARSIAGEAKVPFLFTSGSDFVEMYAGVGASRIRRLFKDARRHPSCIVFIDELDAVGRSRGGSSLSHEEREQTLNQLLVEMDGFAPNQGIVVVAATNRPDILDPALLRPGRFDRQVTVGVADVKGREQILRIHARKVALDGEVDLRQIARGTPGFSGAELANLVNEAALLAVRGGRQIVTDEDFDQARDKVLMGAERKSLSMSEQERITCAYHESGHAVVAALLPGADPLHKVTIIPRGRALGVTMQLPEGDRHTHSREYLDAQIAILMGGPDRRGAVSAPDDQRRRQRHRTCDRDCAPHGLRVRHVGGTRSAGVSRAVEPVGCRSQRRHQRGDRAAGGRRSARDRDARLRNRASDRREEPRGGARDGGGAAHRRVARRGRDQGNHRERSVKASRYTLAPAARATPAHAT